MTTLPERADLADKLESHYQELIDLVRGRPPQELGTPLKPGEWTALQQLEHHILTETVWASMIERTASQDEPDLADLWATYRRVEEQNPFPPPATPRGVGELMEALQARHAATMALLDSLPDSAFERKGIGTGFGNLTILQMFRAVYRHCRMHIDQVQGREPSFQPRRVQ